jgi:TonB family protein
MARVKSRSGSVERRRRVHLQASIGQTAPASQTVGEQDGGLHDDAPILALVPQVPRSEEQRPENDGPKPASDLALDLVLNEIVLQARLTTNATGAVVALERSGELVCRATTGATASDVAGFLNTRSGISATCFESGAIRRIDDIESDSHADAVAYRRASVRSILVVPVSDEKERPLGILQIFSPRSNAFCDRDVLTLQAMTRRVAANIELVRQTYNHQSYASANTQSRPSATAAKKFSKTSGPQKQPRSLPKLRLPRSLANILAHRSRLASVDWIAVLAKSSIALVLIAGTMLARSCWQHGASSQFAQAIRQPAAVETPTRPLAKQPTNTAVSNAARPSATFAGTDPATWPSRVSSREVSAGEPSLPRAASRPASPPQGGVSSITIQRKPVHKVETRSAVGREAADKTQPADDLVLFENHKPVSQPRISKRFKSPAKDPAAEALPNAAAAGGRSRVETLPTQAAMARLIQRVEPEYPNGARQQHIQGTVLLDVVVNESGTVDGLALVSGESQLLQAAAEAVRQWHFQPLIKSGQPKKFESRVSIDFILASEASSQGR